MCAALHASCNQPKNQQHSTKQPATELSQKLFVVGAPRSGTSYLARAVSLADDVAFFEESGAFYPFGSRLFPSFFNDVLKQESVFRFNVLEHRFFRFTDNLRGLDRLNDLVQRMLLHTKLGPYDLLPSNPLIEVQQCRLNGKEMALQKELLSQYRRQARKGGAESLFSALFVDFVQLSGKKHLLEKTPDHIGFVPVIRIAFPDSKIILMRRDKKDAIASFVKHFDARTTLRNRFLSDHMLLKKQCRACRYYEQIEQWLVKQPWCYPVDYEEMMGNPLGTVEKALSWAGLMLNKTQHGRLFVPGKVSSSWDRLNETEQRLVAEFI